MSILSSMLIRFNGGYTKKNLSITKVTGDTWASKYDLYVPAGTVENVIILLHGGSGSKEGIAAQAGVVSNGVANYSALKNASTAVMCIQGQACVGNYDPLWNPNTADTRSSLRPNGIPTWSAGSMYSGQNDPLMLKDAAASMRKQFPGARVILAGHSNGGMMTVRMWMESPTTFDAFMSFCGPLPIAFADAPLPVSRPPIYFRFSLGDTVLGIKDGVKGAGNHFNDPTWSQQPVYQTAEDVVPPPGRGGWMSLPAFYNKVTGYDWSESLVLAPFGSVRRVNSSMSYSECFTVDLLSGGSHSLTDQQTITGESAFTTMVNWIHTHV